MTKEEFIKELEDSGYNYNDKDGIILVDHNSGVDLSNLTEIPSGVTFSNNGELSLDSLESIPSNVIFDNKGDVWLNEVETISPDAFFSKNTHEIILNSLERIPPGVVFENGSVKLSAILNKGRESSLHDYFSNWRGNINRGSKIIGSRVVGRNISPERLLTKMISIGLFDREK
jgi:hypothetical protein